MLQRFLKGCSILLLFLTGSAQTAWAEVERFESGLLARFSRQNLSAAVSSAIEDRAEESVALQHFLEENFASQDRAFEWRPVRIDRDATHAHALYQLHYEARPVAEHFLKVHYGRSGRVDYASSSWRFPFTAQIPPPSGERRRGLEDEIRLSLLKERGIRDPVLKIDPVLWVSPSGRAVAALEVIASDFHGYVGHFFVDELNGRRLAEVRAFRSLEVPGQKVYKKSPIVPAFDTVTLSGLASLDTLLSETIHVLRHENESAPRLVEVSAQTIFADDKAFQTDPDSFESECGASKYTNDPVLCPNQGFDGVNVYYHVQSYRERLNGLLAEIGASSAVLRNDPLTILVNAFVDSDPNSEGNDRNNAYYIPEGCTEVAGSASCLIFVPPAKGSASICGSGTIKFYDPAREALVLVHEYQHYVTDMIANLTPGSADKPKLGDALHEGYSDYFGASQVSRVVGSDVTLVGEYFLQECSPVTRQLATIQVYLNSSSDLDPHYSGTSWASGLWALRVLVGAEKADLIALKSLFFLPVLPTSFDAVEALVKADQSLNAGNNVVTIRDIFYSQVKFLGGKAPPFDINTKLTDVGFSGCNSVARPGRSGSTWLVLGLWVLGTILVGRHRRRLA